MAHKFRPFQRENGTRFTDRCGDCGETRDTCNFNAWWSGYWKNRTDTIEHTVAKSTARDAWDAGRKSR